MAASASATDARASAVQPAPDETFQSLTMLASKQSWKIGKFKVTVWKPWTDTYTYEWEGKKRETTAWRCTLVDAADPTQYCMGEFKLTTKNKDAFDKHVKTHVQGAQLVMSNISPVEGSKTQYMSCSVRVNVNMASTTLKGIFGAPSAAQPVPKTTVAKTKDIQQNQSFDLTACILSRGAPRNGGDGRKVFDLELADGSKDGTSGKVQTVNLSVFAPEADVANLLDSADNSIKKQEPVTFVNLRGGWNADQNAYSFTSARKGFSMTVANSPRAAEMRANAAELYNLQEKAAVPQTQWTPTESFADKAGVGITMKFMKAMGTSDTGIEEIDSESTLWQINWAQILEPPPGTELRTKDGSRLWFPVLLRDFDDSMTLYMTELAALKCSKQTDASSFEEAYRAGRLAFPIVSSAKILRKKGDNSKVDFFIVDCDEQAYASAPTTKSLEMLTMLPHQGQKSGVEQPADVFVAAPLADIHASTFYPLTVRYAQQELPEILRPPQDDPAGHPTKGPIICHCSSVLALVSSTKASTKRTINEKGTTVVTHGVKDLLSDDSREYTLTSHCTTDTHMDFMLTPAKRAKQQSALVVICGILDQGNEENSAVQPARNFLVESVMHLHDDDAKAAKTSLLKLVSLIALAGHSAVVKRERSDWSADANPAKMAKCRSIARYPTGEDIPAYKRTV